MIYSTKRKEKIYCLNHESQILRSVYYLDYEGIPKGSSFKKTDLLYCPQCKNIKRSIMGKVVFD